SRSSPPTIGPVARDSGRATPPNGCSTPTPQSRRRRRSRNCWTPRKGGGADRTAPAPAEGLLPLSAARERFAGVCALALPDPDALAAVTDKRETLPPGRRPGRAAPPAAVRARRRVGC